MKLGIGIGVPFGRKSRLNTGVSDSDIYFNNVILLMHADGEDGSTNFIDSSKNTKIITAYNQAQLSSAQKVFGSSSMYFNSETSHARITPNADFTFNTDDLTVEFFAKYSSYSGARPFGMFNGQIGVLQLYIVGGQLGIETNDSAGGIGGSVPLNTWTHIAASKEGGVIRTFVGGNKVYEYTDTRALVAPTTININQYGVGSGYGGVGYIDEVRVTRGVARYTSNFIAPTKPFPNK